MKSMLISIFERLYSLQYVHTSHITGTCITIYRIIYKINPPSPIPHWPVLSCVKVNHACLNSSNFFFIIYISCGLKKKRKTQIIENFFFFFRKILSWIIYYMCVCCNLKQYICAWIFIRTLHSWNMYVCHSNAKYSHYINVRLFFCIFSWKIFLCVLFFFLFCQSRHILIWIAL